MRQIGLKIAIIGNAKMVVDFHKRKGFRAFDISFGYHLLLPSSDLRKWLQSIVELTKPTKRGFCFIRING